MDFDQALARLLQHEGGYSNDPNDAGGETNLGISRRAYPGEDIKGMTRERAALIYRRDYWGPAGCDAAPDALRFELFDMAVNAGVGAAVRALQLAVGANADGVLGPQTLLKLQSANAAWVLRRFQGARLLAYTKAKSWPNFGAGWVARVARNMMEV